MLIQVTTYNEDFKAERSDRERAQAKILQMKEEVSGLHQMIVIMVSEIMLYISIHATTVVFIYLVGTFMV